MLSMPLICLGRMQRTCANSTDTALSGTTVELHHALHSCTRLSQTAGARRFWEEASAMAAGM